MNEWMMTGVPLLNPNLAMLFLRRAEVMDLREHSEGCPSSVDLLICWIAVDSNMLKYVETCFMSDKNWAVQC